MVYTAEQRERRRAYKAAYRITHADELRAYLRMYKYGASPKWVSETMDAQDGLCAICEKVLTVGTRGLHVDHNHTTGALRALLCASCNNKLAVIEDSGWLSRAQSYLAFHNAATTEAVA